MTNTESLFNEATRLQDQANLEVSSILNDPQLPPEAKLQAQLIAEDLKDAKEVLKECGEFPVLRTSAGQAGVMYLDAILRMIDGLTEVLELIIMGLKLYIKASRKIKEMANKLKKMMSEKTEAEEEESKSMSFSEVMAQLQAAGAAMLGAADQAVIAAAANVEGAAAGVGTAVAEFKATNATLKAEAATDSEKSEYYGVESAITRLEGALAIAKAVIKLIQVVKQTLSWAMSVISVEAVPKLPIPISGWDIINWYEWYSGDKVPDIMKPAIVNIVAGNIDPVTIIQGTLRTPTVQGYIPNEIYDIPKMPFLGGGSIF